MNEEKMGLEELTLAPEEEAVFTAENGVNAPTQATSEEAAPSPEPAATKAEASPFHKRGHELSNLRQENRRVFEMSDKTVQAVFSPSPIYAFDKESGTYRDTVNTLEKEEDGLHFVCDQKSFLARFNNTGKGEELFSIEEGIHKVTVFARENLRSRLTKRLPLFRREEQAKKQLADFLTFPDMEEDTDYEYSVSGSGVKECILVKKPKLLYRYSFVLQCENVTAQMEEDQSIVFLDHESGRKVFLIPAPFMEDAAGVSSNAVHYEMRALRDGMVGLTLSADSDFLNDKDRVFPVTIDPQINLYRETRLITYKWANGWLAPSAVIPVGVENGSGKRMYIQFDIPELPNNPRIKKAELIFTQTDALIASTDDAPFIGIYRVDESFCQGQCTPTNDSTLIDYARMCAGDDSTNPVTYTFDVTRLLDDALKNNKFSQGLVLKALNENGLSRNVVNLISASGNRNGAPLFMITYESNNAFTSSYRTHTHEIGRFGRGMVDLQCGNLMFESEDLSVPGNRMPLTVKHLYNSAISDYQYTSHPELRMNVADYSGTRIGNGFKLNLMQSMIPLNFTHTTGEYVRGYVYTDENDIETYFVRKENQPAQSDANDIGTYEDENGNQLVCEATVRTLKMGENTYRFDTNGRLTSITDSHGNAMRIQFAENSSRIVSVYDGADRLYEFGYNQTTGKLTSITNPDGSSVVYGYTRNYLNSITYPDGRTVEIGYDWDKPASVTLYDEEGFQLRKVTYTFTGDLLTGMCEFGADDEEGAHAVYDYSLGGKRTTITTTEPADEDESEENTLVTTYAFDEEGQVKSEYITAVDNENSLSFETGSGLHPLSGDAGMVFGADNLLLSHHFSDKDWGTYWTKDPANSDSFDIQWISEDVKYGRSHLCMTSDCLSDASQGIRQSTPVLPAGVYTFSAYLRVIDSFREGTNPGGFLRVSTASGTVLGESDHLIEAEDEYMRRSVTFTLESEQSVRVEILQNGCGSLYANAAQLEKNPYASEYNFIENGNFENGVKKWNGSGSISTSTHFNMSCSLKISGDLKNAKNIFQYCPVLDTVSSRETYTLSGWAKANSLPCHAREDQGKTTTFRLRAVYTYADDSTETYTADFAPCTNGWQFASVRFAKSEFKRVKRLYVYCDYDYNLGSAYFDNIQLIRNSLETGLTAADFLSEPDDAAESNSKTAARTSAFFEVQDAYGNPLTETTFASDELGTIYRAFRYNEDNHPSGNNAGNDLVEETDNSSNSRRESITDRVGTKTDYEYDSAGRTTAVTCTQADGTALSTVSYAYDGMDNLTAINRGDGMSYLLSYNAFHQLSDIGIDGKNEKLIRYTYKNGNGRLKQISYANGHTMKATYNSLGQMISEKWYASASAAEAGASPIAAYRYVYDGKGNIVRSLDKICKKEYTYEYEDDKVVRATESDVTLSGETVTARSLVSTLRYYYNAEGKMTKKVITPAGGTSQTFYYETQDDHPIVRFSAGGRTVTSRSGTDSFGRKAFDELQLGTTFAFRQFVYHEGQITPEHKTHEKVKSIPTTQLVSRIILSNGTTVSYDYDAEERITSVTESYTVAGTSVTNTTLYTYDALGQLLTETVNGEVVNSMEYDNYGNITQKNGKTYTYGNTVWKDLLTKVGTGENADIVYDAQGNPTQYLGHTLTWEKGRQLKSFDSNTYTYNANGIRTSKTVNGVKHTYTLDGAKILREAWDGNTLVPLYDNEDSVCGILYNDNPYYFAKNQQGDIIAILDKDAQTVARYSYDAWGICTVTQDTSNTDIANVNPFRYRGYYYDKEIGLYYLQSRYYDSRVGRFVTADNPRVVAIDPTPVNISLYTYCQNEPIFHSDPNGYWVLTLGVSWGISFLIGINIFATLLIDSSWDYGLFIGATLLTGIAGKGLSGSFGFYWGFSRIQDYLNSVTVGFAAGYVVGGTLVYNYYQYPSIKKRFVGIQISYGTTGLYRETAPFDGGMYIPLKSKLKVYLLSCGNNIFKLKNKTKNLKIKITK